MTASIRRSHGGIRRSRTTSRRSGSGPPSMSRRPPREPSTRMASPWPTSRMEIRAIPAGRAITTEPVTARLRSSAATLARRSRRFARDVPGAAPAGRRGRRRGRCLGRDRRARRLGDSGPPVGDATTSRPRSPATDSAAAAVSRGGWSVTLANGRPAAVSTMVTSNRRTTQPGAATTAPRTGGAPATTATPPARASDTDGHRRRDERDDEQVDERRQHRQPTERDEDDRQRRRLRSERDPEALGQPAGDPPAAETPEPLGQRRRPGDQTRPSPATRAGSRHRR